MEAEPTTAPVAPERFPPGLVNAFVFSVFNAFSFQIILSSPMVLYAKSLGASATVLGIIAGMMPLLVIFQIPAASHVARIGYKRFVYGGWGIRVMFIGGMALVPIAGFLSATTRLALILMLLFGFNLSRGISSCAWLPWISSMIPVLLRGKYLARDAACVNVASFIVFLLAAQVLGQQPHAWQFSLLFAFSAFMGMMSLVFLRRMPEGATAEEIRASSEPVPWGEIARYAPFRKLLRMNVAWSVAYGGLSAFIVAYLKAEGGLNDETILQVTAMTFLGGLGSLWMLGSRLDRLGSKPVLTFSFIGWLAIMAGWCLLAGGLFSPRMPLVVVLQLLVGLASSLVTMSNVRLAMVTIPPMGRNHFFALFSVVSNLIQGIIPVFWGLMIDSLGPLHVRWRGFEWNRFSLFFAAVGAVFLIALALSRRLDEPEASDMETLVRDLLKSPLRFWFRLWPRT